MNIFFLGAGFSKPAGLPLGDDLWTDMLEAAKSECLYESITNAIYEYTEYYYGKTGKKIADEEVKLEEFMSYLDIDRHLMLHGGDYSAPERPLKNLIAFVIYNYQKKITDNQFALYEKFAERLSANDTIYTFNYDTILEDVLKRKSIPYRLYPYRSKYDEKAKDLIVDFKDEIVIYKMHGSINWFDKSDYEAWKSDWLQIDYHKEPPFMVFDGTMNDKKHQLLDQPIRENDPLRNIFIVENLNQYFYTYFQNPNRFSDEPFLIAPSSQKLINLNYLADFWGHFSNAIIPANKIVIIGFSLPDHDKYIRQPLYWLIRNFHEFGQPISGKKSKLKIVDFKKNQKEIDEFKTHYRFINEATTDFYFQGLCEEALDFIFED